MEERRWLGVLFSGTFSTPPNRAGDADSRVFQKDWSELFLDGESNGEESTFAFYAIASAARAGPFS